MRFRIALVTGGFVASESKEVIVERVLSHDLRGV